MAKRKAASPAPVIDDDDDFETDAFPGAVDAEDNFWEGHDDGDAVAAAPATAEVDEEDNFDDVGEEEDEPQPAVGVLLSAFAVATLPKRMHAKTLGDQSNDWVLATVGRLLDEIPSMQAGEARNELLLDLKWLHRAAVQRGIEEDLSQAAKTFTALAFADQPNGAGEESEDASDLESPDAPSTDHAAAAASLAITYVSREHVHPDPLQPRLNADADLRDSIRQLGILQPITVRRVRGSELADRAAPCSHCARPWSDIASTGEYVIVDGERRWNGAEVLAMIPVIVRDDQADTYERLKTQLVANTGKPLTPIEEARTFARMLETRDVGVAALARDIGRPASTVHDRVKLLELGPWLPLIDSGSVWLSMAVEHLVPLRGIPDEFHAEAIAKITETHGDSEGGPLADSVEAFGHIVAREYDKYMYPLARTKNDYEKQPLFSTKGHEAECTCGGITWGGSWQGVVAKGRKCCGNPRWWKPLHAAAKKKEREAAGDAAPAKKGELRLELPAGVPTIKADYNAPKGVVVLTDSDGKWRVSESQWDSQGAFDPADLTIDDAKLVRLKYSYGLDRVGTKDTAAVEAARAKWAHRFAPAREASAKKIRTSFDKLAEIYGLTGAGVHQLLRSADVADANLEEIAGVLGIAAPKGMSTRRHDRSKERDEWITKSLKREDAQRIASFLMFLWGDVTNRHLPSDAIAAEQKEAIAAISRKRAPWVTTKAPKPAAKAAKKKSGGGGVRSAPGNPSSSRSTTRWTQPDLLETI